MNYKPDFKTYDNTGVISVVAHIVESSTGTYLKFTNILMDQQFTVNITNFSSDQVEAAYLTLMDIGTQVEDLVRGGK